MNKNQKRNTADSRMIKLTSILVTAFLLQCQADAQNAVFKTAGLKHFSAKHFFHSLFIDKKQFRNVRFVVDTNSNNTFWMAAQEVTNEEYRNFTTYCRDSNVRMWLGYMHMTVDGEELVDWKKPVLWNIKMAEAIGSLLTNYDSITLARDLRLSIDAKTIQFGQWPDTNNIVAVYPDTLCWTKEIGDTITSKNYFSNPSFNNRPVVGVSYWQATAYCRWLQQMWNSALQKAGNTTNHFEVRLPDALEWKAALRIEGPEYKDFVFPSPARIKDKKLIYNLSGNVAEWLYDSTGSQTNSASTKEITGIPQLLEKIDTRQPATAQHHYIGFRYVVRLE